jgi:hypothetical protein
MPPDTLASLTDIVQNGIVRADPAASTAVDATVAIDFMSFAGTTGNASNRTNFAAHAAANAFFGNFVAHCCATVPI